MPLLTACGTTISRALPDVQKYTEEERHKAIQEIESGTCPVLVEYIKDYKVMRDQTRSLK